MNSLVSLAGIDQAISNLLLNQETQKAKLLAIVRGCFSSDEELQTVTEIPADVLIAALWDDDPAALKGRRKSLSSLKSALNKSLKALAEQGLNPEGLILSRANVFEVSDEQKKLLLEKAGIGGSDIHLAETIAACKEAFSAADGKHSAAGLADFLQDLEQAKSKIDQLQDALREREQEISHLQEKIGTLQGGSSRGELTGELDGREMADGGAGSGESAGAAGTDGEPLPSDVEYVEIDDVEFEEIATDGDVGLAGADEAGDGNAPGGSEGDGVGVGGGLFDEAEIAAGGSAGSGASAGEAGSDGEPLPSDVEYVEIDAEEFEEIAIAADVGPAGADEAGDGNAPGGSEGDGERVGGDVFDEAASGADGGAGSGESAGVAGTDGEPLPSDVEYVEIVEEEFDEGVIDSGTVVAGSYGVGDDGIDSEGGEADGGPSGDVGFEEFEIVEDDVAGEMANGAGDGFAEQPHGKLLEVLSKYLEPEDALQESGAILVESEEGLVSQLLERFTPKFIKIPAGSYSFGCDEPLGSAHPLQRVMVDQFYLGQYPVTNDLFELFVRETGYETEAEKHGYGLVYEGQWRSAKDPSTGLASFAISQVTGARRVDGANWRHPSGPGCLLEHRHNHPVVQVSRADAQAFAAWAGKRLPTEVEWEAAARGTDGRPFPWGEAWDADRGNFGTSCLGDTTPVERYFDRGRSVFGIGDLLGNVYEWAVSTLATPSAQQFILKGGCWHSRGVITACHRKSDVEPWSNIVGFRLAVSG